MTRTHPLTRQPLRDDWRVFAVDELKSDEKSSCVAGPFGSSISSKYFVEKGVPVIRGSNLTAGGKRFVSDAFVYVSEERAKKYAAQHVVKDDLVFTCWGSIGHIGIIPKGGPFEEYIISNKQLKLRVNKEIVKPLYAYLYFASSLGIDYVKSYAKGAAVPGISLGILKGLEVAVPPLPTQDRIVSLVSAYDDLIENNTRRIEILEELARRLHEEWFVHFRFPGHEEESFKESELGEIPEGWEVAPIGEAVKRFTAGKKYSQKTVSPAGAVPVLDQGKQGIIGYHDDSPGFMASSSDPVIVFANHTCYQRLIFYPFSTIQNVIPFKSSDKYLRNIFWLHHATHGLVELNDYKGHWPQFAAKKIPIADEGLAESFGKLVEPMYHQMLALHRKSANLRAQRDLLLPKLVSGEIDVSDVPMPDDKEVEAA